MMSRDAVLLAFSQAGYGYRRFVKLSFFTRFAFFSRLLR